MLDRLRALPSDALGLADVVTRRALGNAASAAEMLHRQNGERAALLPAAEHDGAHSAGELTRLPREECLRLLRTRHVGRLAYVSRADTPDLVPVNYTVEHDGRIFISSGPGPKLLAAQRHALVAFEVDDIDEAARCGWSVVVAGRAEAATDSESQWLAGHVLPWAAGPRHHLIRITPRRIEGRQLS